MTLDEAIAHANEVGRTAECAECRAEHIQLAGWLETLRDLLNQETSWKTRLLAERRQLRDRMTNLDYYLKEVIEGQVEHTGKTPISLLQKQRQIMQDYNAILTKRIKLEGLDGRLG